jgi:hypothetical protein
MGKLKKPSDQEVIGGLMDDLESVVMDESEDNASPARRGARWTPKVGRRSGPRTDDRPKQPDGGRGTADRSTLFAGLFEGLPAGFEERAAALGVLQGEFRRELAARLQPALNAYLGAADPKDAASKRQLADALNACLAPLDLAVRCPVTGQPSKLYVQGASKEHPHGQFLIKPQGFKTATATRKALADLLPLHLVEARPRREALAEWHHGRDRNTQAGGPAK